MKKLAIVLCVTLFAGGCARHSSSRFSELSEEFVYTTLAFSPSLATGAGLHEYRGQRLDDMLDDMSPATQDRHLRFYKNFESRLAKLKTAELTEEEQMDPAILRNQVALAKLELTQIRSDLHNPTFYVETLGNALFAPFVLDFAPLPDRMRHIIARLGKVPLFLDQASTNLESSAEVWTRAALDGNAGNIELVNTAIRAKLPPDLRKAYDAAVEKGLAALRKFQDYLKSSLMPRQADWRLGSELYPASSATPWKQESTRKRC
jgi:hypothetical protein